MHVSMTTLSGRGKISSAKRSIMHWRCRKASSLKWRAGWCTWWWLHASVRSTFRSRPREQRQTSCLPLASGSRGHFFPIWLQNTHVGKKLSPVKFNQLLAWTVLLLAVILYHVHVSTLSFQWHAYSNDAIFIMLVQYTWALMQVSLNVPV